MIRKPFFFRMRSACAVLAATLLLIAGLAHAEEHLVQPGENMWSIARAYKSSYPDASLSQIIWGLIRANPDAFPTGPTKLKSDTRLLLPSATTVFDTTAAAAEQKVNEFYDSYSTSGSASQQSKTAAATSQIAPFRESADARSLSAEPEQRYQQLASLEERYAGDVDYDYGYGSVAVDTGNFSQAVFPLQRAVATQPDFAGARLELARAYYGVGDNESARREFTRLRDEQPPPRVEEMIHQYLDAIDRRAVEYQQQQSAYAELSAGHDSNANGATDSQVFLGFNLNDRSRATSSAYYGLNLGGLFSYPLAPGWRTQADAQFSTRQVPDAPFVDSNQARAGAALEWRNGTTTVNGTASYSYAELDGQENNNNTALDLATSILLSESWQLGLGARRAALRFVDALSVQDVDSTLVSVALSTSTDRFQWSGGLTGGKDDAVQPGSPFSRSLFGARLSAFMNTGNSRYLQASVAGLQSNYDDLFFGSERKDTQYSAQLGLEWRDFPVRLWGIKTQLTYVDNRSDIVIYDYDRFDIGLALRREFR